MKISTFKRVTVGTALGGALLLSAGMGLANAEARDGQVDVVVGTAGVLSRMFPSARPHRLPPTSVIVPMSR